MGGSITKGTLKHWPYGNSGEKSEKKVYSIYIVLGAKGWSALKWKGRFLEQMKGGNEEEARRKWSFPMNRH